MNVSIESHPSHFLEHCPKLWRCPKCGPVVPITLNGKISCPNCYRRLWSSASKPSPLLIPSQPAPLPRSETKYIPYVNSSLALITAPSHPSADPEAIYIGPTLFWRLTPAVYAKLWQTVELATTSGPKQNLISGETALSLVQQLGYVESVLFEHYPECGAELARLVKQKLTMPQPPFIPNMS